MTNEELEAAAQAAEQQTGRCVRNSLSVTIKNREPTALEKIQRSTELAEICPIFPARLGRGKEAAEAFRNAKKGVLFTQ